MDIFASDTHIAHSAFELNRGRFVASTECPERAQAIATRLRDDGHQFFQPTGSVDHALLTQIHDADYIEFLSTAWDRWVALYGADTPAIGFSWPSRGVTPRRPTDLIGQLGYHSYSADCSIVAGTWPAAAEGAALAQAAAERVVAGSKVVYALCRPPGHHATSNQFGGYCFINNCAIAAQTLLNAGRKCVVILDIDYHHGNGTQSIFYARNDVVTISVHADPVEEYPWFAGYTDERGSGDGDGCNLNLPLPRGTDLQTWMTALEMALVRVQIAEADALVVALGVDTYSEDPLGTFGIATENYTSIGKAIAALGLPTVIVQEGGYAVDDLGANVSAFLSAFNP